MRILLLRLFCFFCWLFGATLLRCRWPYASPLSLEILPQPPSQLDSPDICRSKKTQNRYSHIPLSSTCPSSSFSLTCTSFSCTLVWFRGLLLFHNFFMCNALNCDGDCYNGELMTLFFSLCLLLRLRASHSGLIGCLLGDLVDPLCNGIPLLYALFHLFLAWLFALRNFLIWVWLILAALVSWTYTRFGFCYFWWIYSYGALIFFHFISHEVWNCLLWKMGFLISLKLFPFSCGNWPLWCFLATVIAWFSSFSGSAFANFGLLDPFFLL